MYIDHINIAAPAELLRKARNFYCDVLDLQEGPRPEFSTGGYWLYSREKAIIHLSEKPDRRDRGGNGYFDHFALRTSNLAGVIRKLRTLDIPFKYIRQEEIALNQVFFKDPSSTGVEVNATGPAIKESE